ncbi:signal transduction histidine kinase [Algoriphagus ratkowskyi]|uniref:histidine kinase n=1 Tax=Algoriphagus ratkowskyi TaxID=57028 RepID=A0A2W7RC55_9BACT|nr:ATP-binding protein [Algoriphagus ratkowskyi]PZX55890.1 signal transduction histidine kinase [Algoriphagus ratkowskyi]TXD77290.1 HAMP domain-containing protein [Algoriphagus ratkowskyi]
MNVSYKERIARRLTLVTALIVLVVFAIIYLVVNYTVIESIDRELKLETDKHVGQIFIVNGEIRFVHKDEWQEQEHSQIQLNPIFIEIVDMEGNSMDRSPNLGENHLSFYPDRAIKKEAWTLKTGSREVRQMQIPLNHAGKQEGYMLVAKSFEDARELLTNLRNILLILYPGILISLFLSMRFLAGKSILPIKTIIQKTNLISQSNLNERIAVAEPNDEIAQLTRSINELLARLEQSMIREKQFTSDASHELRTPLAVMRGTLEVLIRKPRTSEEYVEKVKMALGSIDRMSEMIDQLLSLARAGKGKMSREEVELISFTQNFAKQTEKESGREIAFETNLLTPLFALVNEKSLQMILNNLTQNAIKYSAESTRVLMQVGRHDGAPFILVRDAGKGMAMESLDKIFDPFYREMDEMGSAIQGTGLGLAIVKKLALESDIRVKVESQKGQGSSFRLIFVNEV